MTTITIRSVNPDALRAQVFSDPAFIALQGATPAQIDTYLTNNVTTLAQARPVLRLLLQSVSLLIAQANISQ